MPLIGMSANLRVSMSWASYTNMQMFWHRLRPKTERRLRSLPLALVFGVVAVAAAWAAFDRGLAAYMEGDFKTAFTEMKEAAEAGDATAANNLGVMFSTGRGTDPNPEEAVEWYRKAAAKGDDEAQFNLGVAYEQGQGVPQDYAAAARWYRLAAEKGNPSAQYNLGALMFRNLGGTYPPQEALKWYRAAAAQGDVSAMKSLGDMLGSGEAVPQDLVGSATAYRTAAEAGDAEAQRVYGAMLAKGVAGAVNKAEALSWYTKAAEQGDVQAQYNLGRMYAEGDDIAADDLQAYFWLSLAADHLGASELAADASERRKALAVRLGAAQADEADHRIDQWHPSSRTVLAGASAPSAAPPKPDCRSAMQASLSSVGSRSAVRDACR